MATGQDTRTLAVSLVAKTELFNRNMNSARSSLSGFQRTAGGVGGTMRSLGSSFAGLVGTGGALLVFTNQMRTGIREAIEFESAFANVRKTVNASEPEFAALRRELTQLSVTTGESATELFRAAGAAGQIGIRTENIARFTEVMSEMAIASNLTSDEAAIGFSKWALVTGLAQEKIENLTSSVVALGNSSGANEGEILDTSLRFASMAKNAKMADSEIAALAASLISVGMAPEAGGTAMSRIITDIGKAAATGGKELEIFAALAGQSSGEFQQAFGANATNAILSVAAGVDRFSEAGGNTYLLLEKLGMEDIRISQAMLGLANSNEKVTENLKNSAVAFEENNARSKEAAERYKTTEYQIMQMNNSITALRVEMAGAFMDSLTGTVGSIKGISEALRGMNDLLKPIGGIIGTIGQAFSGLFSFTKTGFFTSAGVIVTVFQKIQGVVMVVISKIIGAIKQLRDFFWSDEIGAIMKGITGVSLDPFAGMDFEKGQKSFYDSGMEMLGGGGELGKFIDSIADKRNASAMEGVDKFKDIGRSLIEGIFTGNEAGKPQAEAAGAEAGQGFAYKFTEAMIAQFGGKDDAFVSGINALMGGAEGVDKNGFGYKITESLMDMFGSKSQKESEAGRLLPTLEKELGYQEGITGEMEAQAKLSKDTGSGTAMRAGEFAQNVGRIFGGTGTVATPGEVSGSPTSYAARGAMVAGDARTGADASIPLLQGILESVRQTATNTMRPAVAVAG